ncbi:MAG TPA: FtsX-like permease family protein [Phycisphaerales bacterium]|nr:FtsX-like permease family protein [Phycisphaerales bacterium]
MYQSLLTRKYLTSRVMPLLAALAVALCSALILIVWSVMGGFLTMLLSTGRSMVGDVTISWPNSGFAYYDDLRQRLEKESDVVAATTPVVDTFGLVSLPDDRVEAVRIKGIDAASYAKTVDFEEALWWKPVGAPLKRDTEREDPRLDPALRQLMELYRTDGLRLAEPNRDSRTLEDAAVVGIELIGLSRRDPQGRGFYTFQGLSKLAPTGAGAVWDRAIDSRITLRLVPLDSKGRSIELISWNLPVANENRTGVYELDRRSIYVPLAALQERMKMNASRVAPVNPDPYAPPPDLSTLPVDPARVNSVIVRAQPGVEPETLRARVLKVYQQFAADFAGKVPPFHSMSNENTQLIRTYEMENAMFVGAIKKETALVLFLLSLIWIVCAVLIMSIFWAMISEKTKDIGILRAMGASGPGVAGLWLLYGLTIGVVGTAIGLGLAWLIVTNINPIHEWLGARFGISVWDPKVYYFAEIPHIVDPMRAVAVAVSGVFFSLLGAVIPAARAALMHPVKALRFE